MKSIELRRGNTIEAAFSALLGAKVWRPITIDSIGKYSITTSLGEHIDLKERYLRPIPLTEEWLIKFGFKYDALLDTWFSQDETATLHINHYTKGDTLGFFETEYDVEIKHVHKLQNLYFELQGEELKSKPTEGTEHLKGK